MTDYKKQADINDEHEVNNSEKGATPAEQTIEACRRNNTDLLQSLIDECTSLEAVANLLNESTSVLGNHAYHEAACRGNYEIIDMLLDQEGFECDPVNKTDGDTPLHAAVRWANQQPASNKKFVLGLIEMMLEAGSDPSIRNKAKSKAADLVDPRNAELRDMINQAEYVMQNQNDFTAVGVPEDDEGPTGSNSDSDFDEVEAPKKR